MGKNERQGWLKPFTKAVVHAPGACLPTTTCLVRNLASDHPGRLLPIEALFLLCTAQKGKGCVSL